MKKVLIITYYWPPSGGGGVQRWLKFVKYLREFGWEPIVYTVENGEYPVLDPSLEKDIPEGVKIIKQPIWEPYSAYKKFTGKGKDYKITTAEVSKKENAGFLNRVSMWVRGRFFIPDPRKYWIKPSIKFLKQYLKENPVDVVVSTGPPHSMHMIALGLKKATGIPWLSDFRDPWTQIDFFHDLNLSPSALRKHQRMEKEVLETADLTITVSPTIVEQLKELGAEKVELITNGYDHEDYPEQGYQSNEFGITYIGSMGKDRNPEALWVALSALKEEGTIVPVEIIGKTDPSVFEFIESKGLKNQVSHIDYLPHTEVVKKQQEAGILLLTINNTPTAKGILTGKLFEYIAAGRPILCIGPHDGDAAQIVNQGFGKNFDYKGSEEIKQFVLELKEEFTTSGASSLPKEQYSRKSLTGEVAKLLSGLV